MSADPHSRRPTAQLRSLHLQAGNVDSISIRSIISTLGDNSFALLLMIFALLGIALTPVPGQQTILALPMIVLAWQWVQNRRAVALPARVAAGAIPSAHFRTALMRVLPVLVWLEKYCRNRGADLLTPMLRQITRITLLLLCLTLFIPIPLTHILPDIAIIIMALGELEDDGYMMLLGLLTGVLCLCAFIVIGMLAASGLLII
ncbi:MAG: exopolysaccharide biosynthesis protein [Bdellovibrionales bacterium]